MMTDLETLRLFQNAVKLADTVNLVIIPKQEHFDIQNAHGETIFKKMKITGVVDFLEGCKFMMEQQNDRS